MHDTGSLNYHKELLFIGKGDSKKKNVGGESFLDGRVNSSMEGALSPGKVRMEEVRTGEAFAKEGSCMIPAWKDKLKKGGKT